jgi:hypothetical protein
VMILRSDVQMSWKGLLNGEVLLSSELIKCPPRSVITKMCGETSLLRHERILVQKRGQWGLQECCLSLSVQHCFAWILEAIRPECCRSWQRDRRSRSK